MRGKGGAFPPGAPVSPVYDHQNSRVIIALASDFLGTEPGAVAAAKRFANMRRLTSPEVPTNRLYVVESNLTITGGMADHRLRMRQADVITFTKALLIELANHGVTQLAKIADALQQSAGANDASVVDTEFLAAVAKDMVDNRGKSLAIPGAGQPPLVHALALAINDALGERNKTHVLFPILDPG